MYYLFEHKPVFFNNSKVVANFAVSNPYEHVDTSTWWNATPFQGIFPNLTFTIDSRNPLLDMYKTGMYELFSQRLIGLILNLNVKFEFFPVQFLYEGTMDILPSSYFVFHLLEILPVVGEVEKRITTPSLMFRVAERRNEIYVHHELKEKLDSESITGCKYTPRDISRLL